MADYSTWLQRRLSVTNLLLDPKNPRLPESGISTQRQIIDELVAHDGIYELARDIATQGYFPTEVLLGVKDGDQTIVLEGNRRLAALKLLINPELAPQDYLVRFRRLAESISVSTISKVPVIIAPSREAATALLLSRHTTTQISAWRRPMQARFYRQLLENGLTPDDLIRQHGVTSGQIESFIRADSVYRLACSLDFPEPVKSTVTNTRKFPLTTLERLVIESPAVRDFLLLKPDAREVLVSSAKPEEFLKAYRTIVADVAMGKIDSREANSTEDIKKYLKGIAKVRPSAKQGKKFSVKKHLSETEKPTPDLKTKPIKRRRAPQTRSVLPRELKSFCADTRVHDVFTELKDLRVEKFRNSSAVLLRLLVEFSVSYYLETAHEREFKAWVRERQKKEKKPRDWYPPLRHLLVHFLEQDHGIESLQLKALNKFVSTKGEGVTLDALDGFMHNRVIDPTERELRAMVKILEPLLRVTLGRVDKEDS